MINDIRKQAAWLAEIYQGMADGRKMQFCGEGGWRDMKFGPDCFSNTELWRFKPEPRECVCEVGTNGLNAFVILPKGWKYGTTVRVTEILEDEE